MRMISERGVPFVEDSTNAQDFYTRNKLRHNVMPVLREINPKLGEAAASAAALARADEEYLSELADRFIAERCEISPSTRNSPLPAPRSLDTTELIGLPQAISGRVVRKLYAAAGGRVRDSLSGRQVKAVLDLCVNKRPSAHISLPGMTVSREYGRIVFGCADRADSFETIYPAEEGEYLIPGSGLKITCKILTYGDTINKSFTSFLFKRVDIYGKIAVRPRLVGDSMKLLGQDGTKSLKKLFIEKRIPVRKRALVPVIADEIGVLAVYGIGIGSRAIPSPGDSALFVGFEETRDSNRDQEFI